MRCGLFDEDEFFRFEKEDTMINYLIAFSFIKFSVQISFNDRHSATVCRQYILSSNEMNCVNTSESKMGIKLLAV